MNALRTEVCRRIVPDEENFVVRESVRMFVVDEHASDDERNLRGAVILASVEG
jgi:hypothetical protein